VLSRDLEFSIDVSNRRPHATLSNLNQLRPHALGVEDLRSVLTSALKRKRADATHHIRLGIAAVVYGRLKR